jgi:two-component sensor histidine kinase
MRKFWFTLGIMLGALILSHGARADTSEDEVWKDELVAIANEIENLANLSYAQQIKSYEDNIEKLTGHEKLSAMVFSAEEAFSVGKTQFLERLELLLEEVEKQGVDASRFQIYADIFSHAKFDPTPEELSQITQELLEFEQRQDLDLGQKIFVTMRLINVYVYTEENHKSLALIDKIDPLLNNDSSEYLVEKHLFHIYKQYVYNTVKDYEKFATSTRDIIKSNTLSGAPIHFESYLHNATVALMQARDYEKATKVNQVARMVIDSFGDESAKFSPAILCMGLSNRTGAYQKADMCRREAEPFLDEWFFLAATFKMQAARTYAHLNKPEKARAYFEAISNDDLRYTPPDVAYSMDEIEALILNAEGQLESAIKKYQEYNQVVTDYYDDKISRITKDLHVASIKEKQALHQVNVALQNETLYQQNSVKRIRSYLNIVILAAISAFVLLLLLASQYRAKQRLTAELQTTNSSMSELLHERELMLQEIHHRIKNNLQLIISLLNLQGRRVEQDRTDNTNSKKGGQRVIREIQGRVHTMSLIHKELYQSDNYDSVDVSDLITNLTAYIFSLFGEKTNLNLELDDLTLEFDKALPVGLITCEIISNSLEHGRSAESESEITIEHKQHENEVSLKFWDNGPGFRDFKFSKENDSLGFLLVNDLSEQAGGEFSYYDCPETGGACYNVQIPL